MKIIDGFKLRNVAGEMVVSGESVNQIKFNKLIVLNSTAAFLWQKIESQEFDAALLSQLLVEEFEIDTDQALTDATKLIEEWAKCGLIE